MNRVHVWMMAMVLLGSQAWALGQEASAPPKPSPAKVEFTRPVPEDLVLRVFSLKEVDINAAMSLVNIHAFRTVQVGPRSLAVYATADQMPRIEKLVAGLEVPLPGPEQQPMAERQWRMVVFLLGTGDDAQGQPVPAVLQPVVRELEQTFPYRGYTLRDALPVLVTPGSNTIVSSYLSGSALGSDDALGSEPYRINFLKTSALPQSGGVLSSEVQFSYRVRVRQGAFKADPTNTQFNVQQLGIESRVSLSPGQTVVLGKVSESNAGGNLFVVLHMPKQ